MTTPDVIGFAAVSIGGLALGLFVLWLTGRQDRAAAKRG